MLEFNPLYMVIFCCNTFFSALGLFFIIYYEIKGFGIPFAAYLVLRANRTSLYTDEKIQKKYGFLYVGYKYKYYYWLLKLFLSICI